MEELNRRSAACLRRAGELLQNGLEVPEDTGKDKPVRVLVAGQPNQRIFGLLHGIFGGFEMMDHQMLQSYHCIIRFGDKPEYWIEKGGELIPVSGEILAGKLSDFHIQERPAECQIVSDSPILRDIELSVMASSEDFEDVDWDEELMDTDYCFFILNATACLSMEERRVLRNDIMPAMNGAMGILLTQSNFIVGQEEEELGHVLDGFLGGDIPVFRLPDADMEDIRLELEKLPHRLGDLREKRRNRMFRMLLQNCLKDMEQRITAWSADGSEIESALRSVQSGIDSLPAQIASAKRRARMAYIAKMKVDSDYDMSQFYYGMIEKIEKEIGEAEDGDRLQDMLPDYIAQQWDDKIRQLQEKMEDNIEDMCDGLENYIAGDIQNYLKDSMGERAFAMADMLAKPAMYKKADASMFRFRKPRDTSTAAFYGAVASGVALVLLSHPIVGGTIAVFGSGHLKKKGQDKFIYDNKKALLEASVQMCSDLRREVKMLLDAAYEELEKELFEKIEGCYNRVIDTMFHTLEEHKEHQSIYVEKLKAMCELRDEALEILQGYEREM